MGAALSAITFGQDAKIAATPSPLPPPPTERPLTDVEILKIRATTAEIRNLQEEYKLEEFNQKVKPKSTEQMAVYQAACQSVGVPPDKMQTECGLATGFDQDGKQLTGADGKPVAPRVWHVMPPDMKSVPDAKK